MQAWFLVWARPPIPNCTRYFLEPLPKIRIARDANLRDNLVQFLSGVSGQVKPKNQRKIGTELRIFIALTVN